MRVSGPLRGVTLACAMAGACSSGSKTCAPAGTYVAQVTRSADPGNCSTDVQVLDARDLQIGEGQVCDTDRETFEGSQTVGGSLRCSYHGTGTLTASASGVAGHATITTSCWGDGTATCTANFDIVYVPGFPDSGATSRSPDAPVASLDGARDVVASEAAVPVVGFSCTPNCSFGCSYLRVTGGVLPIVFQVTTVADCPAAAGAYCLSSAEGSAYLSACCATDADCASPVANMHCLSTCDNTAMAGRCVNDDDYQRITAADPQCH